MSSVRRPSTATLSPAERDDETDGCTSVTVPENSCPMMMGRCSPVMGCGFSLEGAKTCILYQHHATFLTALRNFKKANSDRKRTGPARYSWTSVPQIPHHPGDNRTSPSLSGAEKVAMSSILRSPFPWYLSPFTVLKVVSRVPILADAVRRDC